MQPIRILIADDSENDALLLTRHINDVGFDATTQRVETAGGMRLAIEADDWDVVFCDMVLPEFDLAGALDIVSTFSPDTPLVAMSGLLTREEMVGAITAGAFDVLRKDDLSRVKAILDRACSEKAINMQRWNFERMLDESETRFQALVETLPEAVVVHDRKGLIVFANSVAKKLFRARHDTDLIGRHFEQFTDADDLSNLWNRFDHVLTSGESAPIAGHVRVALDGSPIFVEASATRVDWEGQPALLAVLRDVSERRKAFDRVKKSEAHARAVLENVADGVVIIDETGLIKSFNRAAESIFGYAAGEVIGQNIERLMPENEAIHHGAHLARYLTEGTGRIIGKGGRKLMARRKDGTPVPVEATISEALVGDERLFIGALRDITEREDAESALRQSEERFRLAFETAPHGMALASLDGIWFQVNTALCALLGYDRDELVGKHFKSVTHPDDEFVNGDMNRVLIDGEESSCEFEKRFCRKDGSSVCVLISVSMVRASDGTPAHFISQIFDLTERKAAEDERRRLEQELGQAHKMEALGTLSGGIAHEFNNMLLPVCGLIELSLEDMAQDSDVRENLERALDNAKRAADLADKILSFSHFEEARQEVADFKTLVDEAGALLTATIPSTIPITLNLNNVGNVRADVTQIRQIVMNLGINAMHAIGAETGRILVELNSVKPRNQRSLTSGQLGPGRYAQLSISDTGCGMDESTISRIFEPFFTTKDVGEGTGMGLAFVHGVVTKHGGAIDVVSKPGAGTTFHLYFPLEAEAVSQMPAEAVA